MKIPKKLTFRSAKVFQRRVQSWNICMWPAFGKSLRRGFYKRVNPSENLMNDI